MKKLTNKDSGFTIIEVVLVLAIAGLIFLVVFLALPALQRSQRDSQRRSDLGRFMAQLETYASNNSGAYPTAAVANAAFKTGYLTNNGAQWSDPTIGTTYVVTAATAATTVSADPDGTVYYNTGLQCGASEGSFAAATGTRNIAAMIPLENGLAYCQDNQ